MGDGEEEEGDSFVWPSVILVGPSTSLLSWVCSGRRVDENVEREGKLTSSVSCC